MNDYIAAKYPKRETPFARVRNLSRRRHVTVTKRFPSASSRSFLFLGTPIILNGDL